MLVRRAYPSFTGHGKTGGVSGRPVSVFLDVSDSSKLDTVPRCRLCPSVFLHVSDSSPVLRGVREKWRCLRSPVFVHVLLAASEDAA
jgi:hypothetical protein